MDFTLSLALVLEAEKRKSGMSYSMSPVTYESCSSSIVQGAQPSPSYIE